MMFRWRHYNEDHWMVSGHFEGILPKGPYPPCLRMADRALLAGHPRYVNTFFHTRYAQAQGIPYKPRSYRQVCVARYGWRTQDPWVNDTNVSNWLASAQMPEPWLGRLLTHLSILDMHRQKEYTVVPTAPLFPRLAITKTNDDLLQMDS